MLIFTPATARSARRGRCPRSSSRRWCRRRWAGWGDLLYDFELSRHLDAIGGLRQRDRPSDCCHAAGTTRGLSSDPLHPRRERSVELSPAFLHSLPPPGCVAAVAAAGPPTGVRTSRLRRARADDRRRLPRPRKAQETAGDDEPQGVFSAVLFELFEAALPTDGGSGDRGEAAALGRYLAAALDRHRGPESRAAPQPDRLPARPVLGDRAEPCDLGLALRQTSAGFSWLPGGCWAGAGAPWRVRPQPIALFPAQLAGRSGGSHRHPARRAGRPADRRGAAAWSPLPSLPRGARPACWSGATAVSRRDAAAALTRAPAAAASAAGLQLTLAASPDAAELQIVAGARVAAVG